MRYTLHSGKVPLNELKHTRLTYDQTRIAYLTDSFDYPYPTSPAYTFTCNKLNRKHLSKPVFLLHSFINLLVNVDHGVCFALFCSLRVFGKFGYGFGLQKNSPFTHLFSINVLELRQKGYMETMKSKWLTGTCENDEADSRKFNLLDLSRILWFLALELFDACRENI